MGILGADCHAHLFGHAYPTVPECDYHPESSQIGTVERFLAVLDAHGLSHALVVENGEEYLLSQTFHATNAASCPSTH